MSSIIVAANLLRGEKNAPELPIPYSKIREYAKTRNLSGAFADLVWMYEDEVMRGAYKSLKSSRNKQMKDLDHVQQLSSKPPRAASRPR